MKKPTARNSIGALALLFSSAGMAATVTVSTPGSAGLGSTFLVTIRGAGFTADANPSLDQTSIGATLGITYSSGLSYVGPLGNCPPCTGAPAGTGLPATGPFSAGGGGSYTPHLTTGVLTSFDITTAVGASGSFDAVILAFKVISGRYIPPYAYFETITLIDNQNTFAWFQYNDPYGAIPVTYNQGFVCPFAEPCVTPLPAAVWLLGSALALLGWLKRKAIC